MRRVESWPNPENVVITSGERNPQDVLFDMFIGELFDIMGPEIVQPMLDQASNKELLQLPKSRIVIGFKPEAVPDFLARAAECGVYLEKQG